MKENEYMIVSRRYGEAEDKKSLIAVFEIEAICAEKHHWIVAHAVDPAACVKVYDSSYDPINKIIIEGYKRIEIRNMPAWRDAAEREAMEYLTGLGLKKWKNETGYRIFRITADLREDLGLCKGIDYAAKEVNEPRQRIVFINGYGKEIDINAKDATEIV